MSKLLCLPSERGFSEKRELEFFSSLGSKLFPLRVDPFFRRRQKQFELPPMNMYALPLKYSGIGPFSKEY